MAGTANLTIILSAKDSATQALRALGAAFTDTTAKSRQMRIEFLQAEQRAAALAQRAAKTGSELDQLKADRAAAQVRDLGDAMETATSRSALMGAALGALGAATVTAGIAFASLSVKIASSFETATVDLQNQGQLTRAAADDIADALLKMGRSSEFGARALVEAISPIAGRLETVTGTALTAAQALEVMQGASNLAEASNTKLGDATNALINIMLAYQQPLSDAAQTSDQLFNISRITGIGLGEMAESVGRLKDKLGIAAPDLVQMGALLGELTAQGLSGSRGLLAVSSAINTLTGGSDAVNETLRSLGVGIFDAEGRFIGLRNVIAEMGPAFAKMSDQQQQAAATSLFGASAAGVMLNVIRGGTGAFDNFAERISVGGTAARAAAADDATLATQLKVLRNDVTALMTAFGERLLPVIERITGVVTPLTDAITNNRAAMTAIAIVAGGIMVGALAAITVGFYSVAVAAIAAAGAINIALLGIPIAVAAAAAGIYLLIANWDSAKDKIILAGRDILLFFTTGPIGLIVAHWSQIFDLMPAPVQNAMNRVAAIVSGAINAIVAVINSAISVWDRFSRPILIVAGILLGPLTLAIGAVVVAVLALKAHWDEVWGAFEAVVQGAVSGIQAAWAGAIDGIVAVWQTLPVIWDAVWSSATATVSGIAGAVASIWSGVTGFLGGLWRAILDGWNVLWNAFPGPVRDVMNRVGSIVASAVQHMIDLLNKFIAGLSWIADKVGSLLDKVPGVDIDLKIPKIPSVGSFQQVEERGSSAGKNAPSGRGAPPAVPVYTPPIASPGIIPALTGSGGGGGGLAAAARTAAAAVTNVENGLVTLRRAFEQSGLSLGDFTARLHGFPSAAAEGLTILARAYQGFKGSVEDFVSALHGITQQMLDSAAALASKTGKAVLAFNTGAEGYVDQFGARHTSAGLVTPEGFGKLPDWLRNFLRQNPGDARVISPYEQGDFNNPYRFKPAFPGLQQPEPKVVNNYYGAVSVKTTENVSSTLSNLAMVAR